MKHRTPPHLRVVGRGAKLAPEIGAGVSLGSQLPNSQQWDQRMYAICFDLDTEALARHYPGNYPRNAYDDIRRALEPHGFFRQQGSVYFANSKTITPVQCVLAIQSLVKKYPWFRTVVADIRMLRIEENSDLMPAVGDFELELRPPLTAAE